MWLSLQIGAQLPASSAVPLCVSPSSKSRASPGTMSPASMTHRHASQHSPASWTSVTETTFFCTTAGCAGHFTTKRALVRHQKDKHGLVTRQMMTSGAQMDTESDSCS